MNENDPTPPEEGVHPSDPELGTKTIQVLDPEYLSSRGRYLKEIPVQARIIPRREEISPLPEGGLTIRDYGERGFTMGAPGPGVWEGT